MAQRRQHPTLRVQYRDPQEGWEGILVIDTLVNGFAIGGTRMTRTVDVDEVERLARSMTMKHRALGLAMGGAKVGIRYNPQSDTRFDALTKFFRHIRPICAEMYGFGPDMNTSAEELDRVAAAIGLRSRMAPVAAATKAPELALKRYHESLDLVAGPFSVGEARTGAGSTAAVERAAQIMGLPKTLRIALHGFGVVGGVIAWMAAQRGHRIVAVRDASGLYRAKDGLPVDAVLDARGTVNRSIDPTKVPAGLRVDSDEHIAGEDCDVLVLAATPDVITGENAGAVRAKLIVEAGNIAVTDDATLILHGRKIPVIPDFIASAGGVTHLFGTTHLDFPVDDGQRLLDRIADHVGDATARALDNAISLRLPVRHATLPALESQG